MGPGLESRGCGVLHGKYFPSESASYPKSRAPEAQTIDTVTDWPLRAQLNFTGIGGDSDATGRALYGMYSTTEVAHHELPPLGPGWYVFGVDVGHEGERVAVPMAAGLQYYEAGEYTIDFHPTPATTVEGRVLADRLLALSLLDASGRPIPLQNGGGWKGLTHILETAASGRFRLRDVPVGVMRVRVGAAHELRRGEFTREFEVEFEAEMEPLELRL